MLHPHPHTGKPHVDLLSDAAGNLWYKSNYAGGCTMHKTARRVHADRSRVAASLLSEPSCTLSDTPATGCVVQGHSYMLLPREIGPGWSAAGSSAQLQMALL